MAVGTTLWSTSAGVYWVDVVGAALALALFAASTDLCWGYAGVLNLGAAGSFAIGAYSVAIAQRDGVSAPIGLLIGVTISCSLLTAIGAVAFRRRAPSVQFGLIMLALSLGAEQLMIRLYAFAGGSNGITGFGGTHSDQFLTLPFEPARSRFVLLSLVVFSLLAMIIAIARSQFGLSLILLRDAPQRAESAGHSEYVYRLATIGLSSAIATIAGGLYVTFVGIAYPGLYGVTLNVLVLVWVAFGGQATILGPFLCATALRVLEMELGSHFANEYMLGVGVLLVLTVVALPRGLGGHVRLLTAGRPHFGGPR
jgi:ABC-type branched-subunit amino acid transport system permease subunit